ncbi:unnamed protein product [Ectocarpus sp. 6 AP-2014]
MQNVRTPRPPSLLLNPPVVPDTGYRCMRIGYEEFHPPSWPSTCASEKENWVLMSNSYIGSFGLCGTGAAYPEEFWNCAGTSVEDTQTEDDCEVKTMMPAGRPSLIMDVSPTPRPSAS